MQKMLCTLMMAFAFSAAQAADSYGRLVFWTNPNDAAEAVSIKTTQENLTQAQADEEAEAFCRGKDSLAGVVSGQTGCSLNMPLHNTCVAVAYPKSQPGGISAANAVVITSPLFKNVHQIALKQCLAKFGTQGQCALQTVYCTASDYYGGTFKTLLNRLK
ncbi:DUF4189 domain-containing protein [Neisseria sp. ZJ106]|uniref:DUF4189 domain-containing protein n=1 Tax=Neisseria lisongii TaxID=2912188 RepID=A0ABY7RLN1_9NEIS|nr:DUF4189 domain-containing protein [Neisseria lisongii]MCF7521797.1 DUF4189 domain-containing protein [Neisseria lisongii]WCL72172.1 DUF4189 domain-containing protein [Neisseria lisongii]